MTARRGMTLIEILIVIGICAVLMALVFPVYTHAREKGRQTTCMSNQRQIAMAINMTTRGDSERLPDAATVWADIGVTQKLLVCPSLPDQDNGYAYNAALSNRPLAAISEPMSTVMTGDAASSAIGNVAASDDDYDRRHSRGYIASYVDGHCKLAQ